MGIIGQIADRLFDSLLDVPHPLRQLIDFLKSARRHVDCVLAQSRSCSGMSQFSQPACSGSPPADLSCASVSRAMAASSTSSSHSISASQSSALNTANRRPLVVTNCTERSASSPLIVTSPQANLPAGDYSTAVYPLCSLTPTP